MVKSNSRLQEINFSNFNLRDAYITQQPEYHSALRDEALFSNYGIKVLIRIPSYSENEFEMNENNVNEFSNFVDVTWYDTTESVIPLFKEYRQNVNENGMAADGTDAIFPLEVIIPTKLHLPKNSRIVFTEYNSREEQISREWEVLGTQMKQLSGSKTYSRIANCVPARQGSFETEELCKGSLWFNYATSGIEVYKGLKAQGTLWFNGRVEDIEVGIPKESEESGEIEFIEKPKYIVPYMINVKFSAKKVVVSVLN